MGDAHFTQRQRRRLCGQDGYGARARNNWGSGELPAPWAEGDVVERVSDVADSRLRGQTGPYFVVTAGFSIDEGDAWYFRVSDGTGPGSDRLHVAHASRSAWWDHDVGYMAGFRLVDTADPDGLAERERLLADGWRFDLCATRECECPCHA